MNLHTFKLSTIHEHGAVFWDFLRLRKHHFVDELGWDIPHDDDVEMDQYDNPTARYSVVTRNGHVVGGARTMATSARWGEHSYMLKDAYDGKLGDIPPDVMVKAVTSKNVWECTRLVVSDSLTTQAERSECLALVVHGLVEMAAAEGADQLISLSPLALTRALRQMGYDASRIGEPYLNTGDGRRYAVLTMPACRREGTPAHAHVPARATHAVPPAVHAPQR